MYLNLSREQDERSLRGYPATCSILGLNLDRIRAIIENAGEADGENDEIMLRSIDQVVEYDPTAYIVRENTNVVVTTEGWVTRVGQLASVEKTRVREE